MGNVVKLIAVMLTSGVLFGCVNNEDKVQKKLAVLDYNYEVKAKNDRYTLSKKKIMTDKSYLVDYLYNKRPLSFPVDDTTKEKLELLRQSIMTMDKEIVGYKKEIKSQIPYNSRVSSQYKDLLNYTNGIEGFKTITQEYYFKDANNGALEHCFIVKYPYNGYVAKFSIIWLGGSILDVKKYTVSS